MGPTYQITAARSDRDSPGFQFTTDDRSEMLDWVESLSQEWKVVKVRVL